MRTGRLTLSERIEVAAAIILSLMVIFLQVIILDPSEDLCASPDLCGIIADTKS